MEPVVWTTLGTGPAEDVITGLEFLVDLSICSLWVIRMNKKTKKNLKKVLKVARGRSKFERNRAVFCSYVRTVTDGSTSSSLLELTANFRVQTWRCLGIQQEQILLVTCGKISEHSGISMGKEKREQERRKIAFTRQSFIALFSHSTFTVRSQNKIYSGYNWLFRHQQN